MAQATYKQDMPPQGGYKSIEFKRIPGQKYFTNRFLAGYLGSLTLVSMIGYKCGVVRYNHKKIEHADRDIAMHPFLLAERDRAYLKYLKKINEEEKVVMKDVPNWKVGSFYSMPVYKTLPENYHLDPSVDEYFAHTSDDDTFHIWGFPYSYFHWIL